MIQNLQIAVWNANGLIQHYQELKTFLNINNIDIMLISETHFTNKSYFKIPFYTVYDTKHPSGKARGGLAIIVKNSIKHYEHYKINKNHIQATSIVIEEWNGPLTIAAIYCPPKYNNKKEHFEEYFNILGSKFLVGGDFNAKHTEWGSRITTPKGR